MSDVQSTYYKKKVIVDLESIYTNMVQEIDSIRSYVNLSSQQNITLFEKLFKEGNETKNITTTLSGLADTVSKGKVPQESRVHAFYRLIGFPVVSKGGAFYNPGFDSPLNNVNQDYKYKIATQMDPGISKLIEFRENYYNSVIANIFAKNKSITSCALALSSFKIRNFNFLTKSKLPFDKDQLNQSYLNDLKDPQDNQLLEYQDVAGEKPNGVPSTRYHIIKPFMVDPRIDFSILPGKRRVCVPFVSNKQATKLVENTFLHRPFIEKVIRERLAVQQTNLTIGDKNKDIVEYLKKYSNFQDIELLQKLNKPDVSKFNKKLTFIKFMDIIRSIMERLFYSLSIIEQTYTTYHWIPIPSTTGPEGGCSTMGLFEADPFRTIVDIELLTLINKQTFEKLTGDLSTSGKIDAGDFSFSNVSDILSIEKDGFEDTISVSIPEALAERTAQCDKANQALKDIEIIMGEFSGLGLCDIIAIIASLYLVDIECLVSLLDDAAYSRFKTVQNIDTGVDRVDITTALIKFESVVKDMYNIMDRVFDDLRQGRGVDV